MAKAPVPCFRPCIQVVTERSCPEPIFMVAFTGVDFWLRLDVPADMLVRSPHQKQREIGRLIREHYAARKGSALPFGKITGSVFRSLPNRSMGYSVAGVRQDDGAVTTRHGEVSLRLR